MNNIIVDSMKEKEKIYQAIQEGKKVYYTVNKREIPNTDNNLYENDIYKIVIDPVNKQWEYIDKEIYSINYLDEIINKIGKDRIKIIDMILNSDRIMDDIIMRIDKQYKEKEIEIYLKSLL